MVTQAPDQVVSMSPESARNGRDSLHEQYRTLLDRLHWPSGGSSRQLGTLGITSCHGGEGVSTIAANLAVAAAGLGNHRVLLVDCNLAKPSVGQTFGVKPAPGLVEALANCDRLADVVQESPVANLSLLAAGNANGNRPAAYGSASFARLIGMLEQDYDLVVFDMPAAGRSSSAIPLVGLLDGVLLIVEAERIRWEVARRTKEVLIQAGAHLLGVVLNKRQEHVPDWLYRTL